MLPNELLATTKWKNNIKPKFANINADTISTTEKIINVYKKSIGQKQKKIREELSEIETSAPDYRFIKGLATLMDRKSVFKAQITEDPIVVRREIFTLSAKKGYPTTQDARTALLSEAAQKLDIQQIEDAFYADLDSEKTLEKIDKIEPVNLLKQYNLSLAQTLLFYSTELTFTAYRNWQNIFRTIKLNRLIYTAEKQGQLFTVKLDGPLSLFKLNRRYGISLAKILPEIIKGKPWSITAQILHKNTNRLLTFQLDSNKNSWLFNENAETETFDSKIESEFSQKFNALKTPWKLTREPEPITTGNTILIPDFTFELGTTKIYMEILGFWTREYLKRKIEKLSTIKDKPFILAVNEELACEKLTKLSEFKIIYYKQQIPLKKILDELKKHEEIETTKQSITFNKAINKPIITLQQLATETGLLPKAILYNKDKITTHQLIGETFIHKQLLNEICQHLQTEIGQTETKLTQATSILHKYNLPEPTSILTHCGYKINWHGIATENATIKKKE